MRPRRGAGREHGSREKLLVFLLFFSTLPFAPCYCSVLMGESETFEYGWEGPQRGREERQRWMPPQAPFDSTCKLSLGGREERDAEHRKEWSTSGGGRRGWC